MKKQIIGRTDYAHFPALGLSAIRIKIDTGAYTSSLHCQNITEENGCLKCAFIDSDHSAYDHKIFIFEHYRQKTVKSSNGQAEERYFIKTKIRLFNSEYAIELSLSDRSAMRYPVLIGRKFLKGKFLVDPALKNLSITQENNPSS